MATHTAFAPQSASLAQLISGTQAPVRKSQVVPLGQSLERVQPDGGGGGGGGCGTQVLFTHASFGGQSADDLHIIIPLRGTH